MHSIAMSWSLRSLPYDFAVHHDTCNACVRIKRITVQENQIRVFALFNTSQPISDTQRLRRICGNGFQRLRLGIGHPGDKHRVTGHVLKKSSTDDQIDIERAIEQAMKVLPDVIDGNLQKAMNQLHSN